MKKKLEQIEALIDYYTLISYFASNDTELTDRQQGMAYAMQRIASEIRVIIN